MTFARAASEVENKPHESVILSSFDKGLLINFFLTWTCYINLDVPVLSINGLGA
jgi:hypothetical protein